MKAILATFIILAFNMNNFESSSNNNVKPNYTWKKITNEAAFSKSYNFQLFTIDDKIWAFHHKGNYYSHDGKSWTKSPLTNSINNLAFLDYVIFNNSVLGLGHFEGNIEKFTFKSNIYKTEDLKKWSVLTTKSNIPKRFFYHPFVFNNKIWIIGGSDGQQDFDDVWSSADGITWKKEADKLPFGKRNNQQFEVLNGKIYMLSNDVWSSTDGIHWQREVAEIVKGVTLFGYESVIFDNKIFLLGCTRNNQFTSKVLWSENGKNWHEMDAPWSPRGGIAATVFKNKLYMTGGKYGGTPNHTEFIYSNDVWVLEKTN
jgi:hypothetical protein